MWFRIVESNLKLTPKQKELEAANQNEALSELRASTAVVTG
jgi:hypothetical protein